MSSLSDIGVIVQLDGDNALVRIPRHDACRSCGAAIFCNPNSSDSKEMLVKNNCNGRPGDQVTVTETGHMLLTVSAVQYGIPLMGFILGILLSTLFHFHLSFVPVELIQLTMGILGLAAGGWLARILLERLSRTGNVYFEIQLLI